VGFKNFDKMDGHEFEYYCANLLRRKGFGFVRVTKGSGDQGVDVIAYRGATKYVVQCKRYSSNVGNNAIQQVYSGQKYYKAKKAMVITNQYFTQSAKDLAKSTGVILWDRDKLR